MCHIVELVRAHGPLIRYSSWVLESANNVWKDLLLRHSNNKSEDHAAVAKHALDEDASYHRLQNTKRIAERCGRTCAHGVGEKSYRGTHAMSASVSPSNELTSPIVTRAPAPRARRSVLCCEAETYLCFFLAKKTLQGGVDFNRLKFCHALVVCYSATRSYRAVPSKVLVSADRSYYSYSMVSYGITTAECRPRTIQYSQRITTRLSVNTMYAVF